MATANPSTTTDDHRSSSHARADVASEQSLLVQFRDHPLTGPLQAAAFWAAVVLPFVAMALLLGPGLDTVTEAATLLGVLVCNVVAVVGGHGYDG